MILFLIGVSLLVFSTTDLKFEMPKCSSREGAYSYGMVRREGGKGLIGTMRRIT